MQIANKKIVIKGAYRVSKYIYIFLHTSSLCRRYCVIIHFDSSSVVAKLNGNTVLFLLGFTVHQLFCL